MNSSLHSTNKTWIQLHIVHTVSFQMIKDLHKAEREKRKPKTIKYIGKQI